MIPEYQAIISSTKSATDKPTRIVSARAILRESPLPLARWNRALPKLATIATRTTTISTLIGVMRWRNYRAWRRAGRYNLPASTHSVALITMGIRLQLGSRVFAPSWLMTIATLVLLAAFVSFGRWQWHRAAEKQVLWDSFARGTDALIDLESRSVLDVARYAHVRISGGYDSGRQFLLDNRTLDGRAGYEVLTPFRLTNGRWLLVNRGWVPFTGFRDRLPDVGFAAPPELTLRGRLDELPSAGLASGRAAPATSGAWPRVTNYPTARELESALGSPLEARVLLLDRGEPLGYERRWRPPGMEPVKHTSYAIQWWSFAFVLLGLYFGLNLRKVN